MPAEPARPVVDEGASDSRERDVLTRIRQNTELQRQIAESRIKHEAGANGVPWRQVRAAKMERKS
jgi:hypothetical protein